MVKKQCDVVVIGSGIGGMAAAARLAHAGYKTVVLEALSFLGGRYTYQDYKGYKLTTAAWVLLLGRDDPAHRVLIDTNAPPIEVKVPGKMRYRVAGKDYEVPEKGFLGYILPKVARSKEEASRVLGAVGTAIRWQEPADTISFKEWLLQYTDNVYIYNIFQSQVTVWNGLNLDEISAGEFVRQLKVFASASEYGGMPKNGLKDVIDSLSAVINRDGGEIHTKTKAHRILVKNGKAVGVVAKGPEGELEVQARVVISNVGPAGTVALVGEENVDRAYLRQLKENLRPTVGLNYFIASDEPLTDFPGYIYMTDARRTQCYLTFTHTWPGYAPKGKHLMICYCTPLSTLMYDPKQELQVFLMDLKDAFPDYEKKGGKLLMARNYRGAWPTMRCWPGRGPGIKTPIENLYNVGDGVNPPGYAVAAGAAQSALLVAEDVKARVKLA